MKSINKMRNYAEKFKKTENNNQNNKQTNNELLKTSLKENINKVKHALGESSDLVTREFKAGENGQIIIGVFYTDGLVDKTLVQDSILEPLMFEIRKTSLNVSSYSSPIDLLKDFSLTAGDMKEIHDFKSLFSNILSGETVILFDGFNEGFSVSTRGWTDRGVTEPTTQQVVRGPKDSFNETLRTNTAMIRRRIKDPNLWMETKQIGRVTQTDVTIAYIKGIVDDKIVDEVRSRLDRIDTDAILESGYIEEFIQDETYTPFPTVYNTERPDIVAAGLLEGRVAIIVDGTPFVLLVPVFFIQYFHASEDYYHRFDIVVMVRVLRLLAFFLSLLTPAAYIAVTTFHQEMLPTPLLIGLAAQREGVPFPAFIEALMMIIAFEILHEAGNRMKLAVGSAISIVGALVLGEAAVQAGLVSPVMVIVVSITAISSFTFPAFDMAIPIRMIRLLQMVLAATFGLFGIIIGLIAMVLHLCSLRSFGVPYMSPFAPFVPADQKDSIFRVPHWGMFTRPRLINQTNVIREEKSSQLKPKPPQNPRRS